MAAFAFFGGVPSPLDPRQPGVRGPSRRPLRPPHQPRLRASFPPTTAFWWTRPGWLIPRTNPGWSAPSPTCETASSAAAISPVWTDMQAQAAAWSLDGGRRSAPAGRWGGRALCRVPRGGGRSGFCRCPPAPFELASWHTPKVAPDAHVMVGGALYSVPYRFIGRRLDVRVHREHRHLLPATGELLKTHARVKKGKRSTDWADYPPEKVAFLMRTPAWCRPRRPGTGTGGDHRWWSRRSRRAGPAPPALRPGGHRLCRSLRPRTLERRLQLALFALGIPATAPCAASCDAGRERPGDRGARSASWHPAHLHGPDTLFAHLEV